MDNVLWTPVTKLASCLTEEMIWIVSTPRSKDRLRLFELYLTSGYLATRNIISGVKHAKSVQEICSKARMHHLFGRIASKGHVVSTWQGYTNKLLK